MTFSPPKRGDINEEGTFKVMFIPVTLQGFMQSYFFMQKQSFLGPKTSG